jgi:serine/threonine protein kinase
MQLTAGGEVKVADFGLSRHLIGRNNVKAGGFSLAYVAPELLLQQPADFKADVFSFGVVLYELFTLRAAYEGFAGSKLELIVRLLAGIRPDLPNSLHPTAKAIITQCWDTDPSKRPSMMAVQEMLRKMAAA